MMRRRKSYLQFLAEDTIKDNCFDPLGSYTGKTAGDEQPVQDADDL